MSGLYNHNFSPARAISPHIRHTNDPIDCQYLTELVAEHHNIGPFMQIFPLSTRLLNQDEEFFSICGQCKPMGGLQFDNSQIYLRREFSVRMKNMRLYGSEVLSPTKGLVTMTGCNIEAPSPMASANVVSNVGGTGLGGWNGLQQERLGASHGTTMDWQGAPASPSSYIVKKILRLEIPVDTYPNFNFVGRLLGPRGNSLKRVEASTGCRVYIRGKGSIKDPGKEDKLRGRPGYEHLNDPLHILVEAELPVNIVDTRLRQAQEIIEELLKPVDESQDYYKKQQLRELAMLNSNYREESPRPSGSVSPFNTSGLKRPKTGR